MCLAGAVLCLPALLPAQEAAVKAEVAQEGEVLMRGPIHEAFASPVDLSLSKGAVIAKEPPEPIEELAPDQKPAGDNVVWISGYWAFDDERDEFFWISGIWRAVPAGVQWIPGYWVSVDGGYQWVSGLWVKSDAELSYLPEPPATQEAGPVGQAPSTDHFWVPGAWTWRDSRYVWRPGYWQQAHQGWVWNPARYSWTPQGYLYTAGYWDYDVPRRGLLFAPVYFNRGVYSRAGFAYTPSIALNTALLATNLFVRPQYGHYYFGDYYGNAYTTAGYTPWMRYAAGRGSYDPLYTYARWRYRDDRGWSERMDRDFDNRSRNEDARPPRTYAEASKRGTAADSPMYAASLKDYARISSSTGSKEARVSLEEVSKDLREQSRKTSADLTKLRKERQQLDARKGSAKKGDEGKAAPARFEIGKSPVVSAGKSDAADRQPPKSDEQPDRVTKEDPTKKTPKTEDADKGEPTKRPPTSVDPEKKAPPKTDPPKADPPKRDPPKVDPPKVDPPKADPPKTNPPKVDPPKSDPPKANPPKLDPPKKDPPKLDPPKVDPPKANPPKLDPPKKAPPKLDPPKKFDPPKKVDPPQVNPPKKLDPPKAIPLKKDGAAISPEEQGIVVQAKALPDVAPKVDPSPLLEATTKVKPVPIPEVRRVTRSKTSQTN